MRDRRSDEAMHSIKLALAAEALVVCAFILAIAFNVSAISDAASILTGFFNE